MGTVIISTILFIIVTLIVKSICRKHIDAKKNGSVCCGCSKCSCGCNKNK
ncbi:MAG: FeoB-associated Cys-rich membrane protein [Treponema sp.]|nr:FeoB-associated Cys-rich membrane protein [Treponema sp.]MDY4130652.1 FeoB-associated Cys-rich membrane protein [Treponema sp.]